MGTWAYVHQREIADRYDDFVADTPLCNVDRRLLEECFPPLNRDAEAPQPNHEHTELPVVLDLGCGTGRTAMPLAARGYRVVAIDLSQPMLQRLMEKRDRLSSGDLAQAGAVHALRANLVELNCLRDRCADAAVCLFSTLGMIEGRQQRREMLRHVHRLLQPSGRFLVHVHNLWAGLREPGGIRRTARSWLQSKISGGYEFGDARYRYRGLESMFMHRFSRRELLADLRATGFSVQQCWGLSLDGSQQRSTQLPLQLDCGGFLVVAEKQG